LWHCIVEYAIINNFKEQSLMPHKFMSIRVIVIIGLCYLLAACSQQSQNTREQVPLQETSAPQKTNNTPQKPEPVKPESVKPESVKPESVKPESVKPESVKPESVKPEPVKPEPVKPEPVKPEPVKPEPVKPEPVKPEPVETEPVKPEPVKPEPVKPEPVKPEPVKPEPVKPEPVEPEPVEPEPVEPEPVETATQQMTLSGRIQLNQDKIRRQNAEISQTVIYFQPNEGLSETLPVKNHEIITENKRFKPDVLAITQGSTVKFPVEDTILHNVFSVTPGNNFDLGLYSKGTVKEHIFEQAGIVYVHCNVHHAMQADIIVLDTPHFTLADSDGNYQLTGLPVTSGILTFWHPRGQQISVDIEGIENINQIDKTIVISRPKVPKHTNKFGKSYRPTRD
jgi:plastocyanin